MSIVYPLSLPAAPGFRTFKFSHYDAVGEVVSPFSGQAQEQQWQDQHWELDVALPPMLRATAAAGQWIAFLAALHGKFGSFLVGDPSGVVPLGSAALGAGFTTPLVNLTLLGISTISRASGIVTATIPATSSTVLPFSNGSSISVLLVADSSYDGSSFTVIQITPVHSGIPARLIAYQVQWVQGGANSSSTGGYLGSALGVPSGVNSLPTKGWAVNSAGVLLRGDYLQVGSGTTQRLYQNMSDASSDSNGFATLDIFPCVREPLSTGTPITLLNTAGCFRLADNRRTWEVDQNRVCEISFKAREAI